MNMSTQDKMNKAKKENKLIQSSIAKPDKQGYLPLHHAAASKYGTIEMIDNLIKYYKKLDKDNRSKGGANILSHNQFYPLHLAIEADKYRSKLNYSNIVLQMIEKHDLVVTIEQENVPLKLALDPTKTQRLKKVTQEA